MSFEFQNNTKSSLPQRELFFVKIKEEILKKDYELSFVLVGDKKSKELNLKYRNGNYIPNVLSFPIDKTTGEIFINPNQAKKECAKFEMTYKKFLVYLFIHGCLHLKGLDHGKKMDSLEDKYLKAFVK
jgi:probable rRNA maturation factor